MIHDRCDLVVGIQLCIFFFGVSNNTQKKYCIIELCAIKVKPKPTGNGGSSKIYALEVTKTPKWGDTITNYYILSTERQRNPYWLNNNKTVWRRISIERFVASWSHLIVVKWIFRCENSNRVGFVGFQSYLVRVFVHTEYRLRIKSIEIVWNVYGGRDCWVTEISKCDIHRIHNSSHSLDSQFTVHAFLTSINLHAQFAERVSFLFATIQIYFLFPEKGEAEQKNWKIKSMT